MKSLDINYKPVYNAMEVVNKNAKKAVKYILRFKKAIYARTHKKWVMMNKNSQNSKERHRNQVRLKGRGCRQRSGIAPSRGNGRTTHGRR